MSKLWEFFLKLLRIHPNESSQMDKLNIQKTVNHESKPFLKDKKEGEDAEHSLLPPTSLHSITCVATATNRIKEDENQDSCDVAENKALNLKAVIVADGLGSYEYAELASKIAVKSIKTQIESLSSKEDIDFRQMFKNAKSELVQFTQDFSKEQGIVLDRENSFGTSLIVALEDAHLIKVAYVGNGAVWHIRGNFNHFRKTKYLPWNALNYLNPHTVQNEMGKEAMYRLISISDDDAEVIPTVFQIEKDNLFFGDMFMICTDGIYSFDQVPIGKVKDGSVWISGEKTMSLFYHYLNDYFATTANLTNTTLQEAMQNYLDFLKKESFLDDDATAGIIITAKAIEYQRKYQKRKIQET